MRVRERHDAALASGAMAVNRVAARRFPGALYECWTKLSAQCISQRVILSEAKNLGSNLNRRGAEID